MSSYQIILERKVGTIVGEMGKVLGVEAMLCGGGL